LLCRNWAIASFRCRAAKRIYNVSDMTIPRLKSQQHAAAWQDLQVCAWRKAIKVIWALLGAMKGASNNLDVKTSKSRVGRLLDAGRN
jgi:hypothetical protein